MIWLGLAGVVIGAKFGDKIGGILGSIDGQGLGNDQQGLGEFGDGQLFSENVDFELKTEISYSALNLKRFCLPN